MESLGESGGGGIVTIKLTCKRVSVGQREGLSNPRSSVRFHLKLDNSNSHGFELNRPSNKGITLLLKVIKAIIIIIMDTRIDTYSHSRSYIDAGTSIYAQTYRCTTSVSYTADMLIGIHDIIMQFFSPIQFYCFPLPTKLHLSLGNWLCSLVR